jgi:hypothetical protein
MYSIEQQKKIGLPFEHSVARLLEIKGWKVKRNPAPQDRVSQALQDYDLWIKKDGESYWVEIKKDVMSQSTGNVCIDWRSLEKSKSSIFILGLPNEYGTDIFKMPLKSAYLYGKNYPIQKKVGQWGETCALIPKDEFIYLPFVRRFTMEEKLDPYRRNYSF